MKQKNSFVHSAHVSMQNKGQDVPAQLSMRALQNFQKSYTEVLHL